MANKDTSKQDEVACSCCQYPERLVKGLVEIRADVYLCDKCADTINNIFAMKEAEEKHAELKAQRMFPQEIKKLLDKVVIGQEDAKKILSVEVYNHYKRVQFPEKNIDKSNILMIGDSGTGKTLLVQTLSKILDLPMAICDCTMLTESGYVGNDIDSMLTQLVIAADGDIEKAEKGIIFVDEIDKLAKQELTSSTNKDPGTLGVQQGLLKILEGSLVEIKTEEAKRKKQFINTKNILFIGAGAFFGLEKILEKHSKDKNNGSIGFSANIEKTEEILEQVEITTDILVEYGFIPEFSGRFPVITKLNKLTESDYRRILIEPENSIISQYQKLLEIDNIDLQFTPEFLDNVVTNVYNSKRGARALRSEIEKAMLNVIYSINDESYGTSIKI